MDIKRVVLAGILATLICAPATVARLSREPQFNSDFGPQHSAASTRSSRARTTPRTASRRTASVRSTSSRLRRRSTKTTAKSTAKAKAISAQNAKKATDSKKSKTTTAASSEAKKATAETCNAAEGYRYGASQSTSSNPNVAGLENARLESLARLTNQQSELLNEYDVPQWDVRQEDPIVQGAQHKIEGTVPLSPGEIEYLKDQQKETREHLEASKAILAEAVEWEADRIRQEAKEEAAAIEASRAAGAAFGEKLGSTEKGYLIAESINTRGGSDILDDHGVPQSDVRMEDPIANGAMVAVDSRRRTMGDADSRNGTEAEVLQYYLDVKAESEEDNREARDLFTFERLESELEAVSHDDVFLEAMRKAREKALAVNGEIGTDVYEELYYLQGP